MDATFWFSFIIEFAISFIRIAFIKWSCACTILSATGETLYSWIVFENDFFMNLFLVHLFVSSPYDFLCFISIFLLTYYQKDLQLLIFTKIKLSTILAKNTTDTYFFIRNIMKYREIFSHSLHWICTHLYFNRIQNAIFFNDEINYYFVLISIIIYRWYALPEFKCVIITSETTKFSNTFLAFAPFFNTSGVVHLFK